MTNEGAEITPRALRRPGASSFIIRLWQDESSPGQMRGEIEHIGTGERRLFVDHLSLIKLLETWQRDLQEAG